MQGVEYKLLTDVNFERVYARDVKYETGRRLRALREREPKITLETLASETRVLSKPRISNYEQGLRQLKPAEAKIIADALTRLGRPTTASYLLGLEHDNAISKKTVSSRVNVERLTLCIEVLDEFLPPHQYDIPYNQRAEIIAELYALAPSEPLNMAEVIRLVRPIRDDHGGDKARRKGAPKKPSI